MEGKQKPVLVRKSRLTRLGAGEGKRARLGKTQRHNGDRERRRLAGCFRILLDEQRLFMLARRERHVARKRGNLDIDLGSPRPILHTAARLQSQGADRSSSTKSAATSLSNPALSNALSFLNLLARCSQAVPPPAHPIRHRAQAGGIRVRRRAFPGSGPSGRLHIPAYHE